MIHATRKYTTLPKNADKILFAEDIVNHILLKLNLPLVSSGIADHRSLVYNAFNPEVRIATDYTYNCCKEDMAEAFEEYLKEYTIDLKDFFKYARDLKPCLYVDPTEKGGRHLMQYCVRVSIWAGKFYMRQFREPPILAVGLIIDILNGIDMVGEGGWEKLNLAAAKWSQYYVDTDKNRLSPDSNYDREIQSFSPPSSINSEASLSPDHQMDGKVDIEEHPEEITGDKKYNAAGSTSSEEPVPLISDCQQITKDVKDDSIVNSSTNVIPISSILPGSSKEASFYSFEDTSSEPGCSKQEIQNKLNKNPSCSYSKPSDSDSKLCETDLKTEDYFEPFGRQLSEKRSAISGSSVNKFLKTDSVQHFKTCSSDNLTTEDLNKSLVDEGHRLKSSCAKSSPTQKRLPKRTK